MKPTVRYIPSHEDYIKVGESAIVFPRDHYSPLVSSTRKVITSTVLFYDKNTGKFETKNTCYVPLD